MIFCGVYVGIIELFFSVLCVSELFHNNTLYYSKLELLGSYSKPCVS